MYRPSRLEVLGRCRWVVGVVTSVRYEDDGDRHVDVRPALGYRRLLDGDNVSQQDGALVTEIMPGQHLPVPEVGARVAVFGTWVLDRNHGWNEIHPIWAIEYLGSGLLLGRLPPTTPVYDPDAGTAGSGGTGGGGGSGSCDPAYPSVCIAPYPPDLDCADVPYSNFRVLPPDPHRFDGDGDGIGCES